MRQSRFNPPRPSPEPIPWPSVPSGSPGDGGTGATPSVDSRMWLWLTMGALAGGLALAVGWMVRRRERIDKRGSSLKSASDALARAIVAFDPTAIPARFHPRDHRADLECWMGFEDANTWIELDEEVARLKFGLSETSELARAADLAARAEVIARRAEAIRLNAVAPSVDGPNQAGT